MHKIIKTITECPKYEREWPEKMYLQSWYQWNLLGLHAISFIRFWKFWQKFIRKNDCVNFQNLINLTACKQTYRQPKMKLCRSSLPKIMWIIQEMTWKLKSWTKPEQRSEFVLHQLCTMHTNAIIGTYFCNECVFWFPLLTMAVKEHKIWSIFCSKYEFQSLIKLL